MHEPPAYVLSSCLKQPAARLYNKAVETALKETSDFL
jgi:hypothetical protein